MVSLVSRMELRAFLTDSKTARCFVTFSVQCLLWQVLNTKIWDKNSFKEKK